jgi:DNA-binding Lrp family transcriptional regulator
MPSSYVLINVESGAEDFVLNQLKNCSDVKEAYVTFGIYDLVAKVTASTMDDLKRVVSNKIRTVNKITSTLTLLMEEE